MSNLTKVLAVCEQLLEIRHGLRDHLADLLFYGGTNISTTQILVLHSDIILIETYKTEQNYLNYKRLPSKIKSYLQVTKIQSEIYHPKNKISSKEDLKQQEVIVGFLSPNGSQKNHRQENKSSQKNEFGSVPVSFFTHLSFFSYKN